MHFNRMLENENYSSDRGFHQVASLCRFAEELSIMGILISDV